MNCTPLHCASEEGHIGVIKLFIANPRTDPMNNNFPLHLVDICQFLSTSLMNYFMTLISEDSIVELCCILQL